MSFVSESQLNSFENLNNHKNQHSHFGCIPMFSLIPEAFAMSQPAGSNPGMMGQFVLIGVIFAIFFLLVIRPQQKKAKELDKMRSGLSNGDKVITTAGIYGTVSKFYDNKDYLLLEIADKTVIKIQKSQISEVINQK